MRYFASMVLIVSTVLLFVNCVVDVVALLQGDVEKNLGWKPIPLFDRDNYAEVASMQVMCIKVPSWR
jgi:hypothetical protein